MATIIRNQKLFCTKCGGEFILNYPIAIDEMTQKIEAFENLHKQCKQTWTEPIADQSKSVKDRAMWWIANGECGMSSKTMWNCFMDNKDFQINHPYDPADFGRCWKLLDAIPEWKSKLYKLKPLSEAWNNLVENWDELTLFYEKKNFKDMYLLMQKLI